MLLEEALDWQRFLLVCKAIPVVFPLLSHAPGGRPPLGNDPDKILESPRRRFILAAIKAEPGISLGELGRRVEIVGGALREHVKRLVEADLVETRIVGRRTQLYPTGAAPPNQGVLELPARRRMAELIAEAPRTSAELADAVGIVERTVREHMRLLIDAGYVQVEPGLRPKYSATPSLRKALH
ncbi:MAG: hypothetical protein QOE90_1495 [Thermoplasmata archaeon]|jgi:predicted transcriptional regulator|nr:hypothetical protein [Thermoplasmata archaeon]